MKRILLLVEQHDVRQKNLVLKEKKSIDLLKLQIELSVCSQIKMNFFAQNLREVTANLVKNFDTVFF